MQHRVQETVQPGVLIGAKQQRLSTLLNTPTYYIGASLEAKGSRSGPAGGGRRSEFRHFTNLLLAPNTCQISSILSWIQVQSKSPAPQFRIERKK
jgi:hypothetical protein